MAHTMLPPPMPNTIIAIGPNPGGRRNREISHATGHITANAPIASTILATARDPNGALTSGSADRYESASVAGSPSCCSTASSVWPCASLSAMWLRSSAAICAREGIVPGIMLRTVLT
jgi:hypothetical protein